MNEQIDRIKNKIGQLKQLDKNYMLFGSQKHKYGLNPIISLNEIKQFEVKYQVKLPGGYVEFLTEIGNGGVGPFYGLEPLQNSLFTDLDHKSSESLLSPGKPFLHVEPWNLKFHPSVTEDENEEEYWNERAAFEEKYYDDEQRNGVLAICNYGCAVSLNLVVNGQEYGNIWSDDRGSDNGIFPSRELGNKDKISFLNWYELWLDNSIRKITANFPGRDIQEDTEQSEQIKKSWWKIW